VPGSPRTQGCRKARIIPIIPGTEKFGSDCIQCTPRTSIGILFKVSEATETLARACEKVGIQRLTHHKLRHFWATLAQNPARVLKWSPNAGHQDGSVLVMKRYTHVRTEYHVRQRKDWALRLLSSGGGSLAKRRSASRRLHLGSNPGLVEGIQELNSHRAGPCGRLLRSIRSANPPQAMFSACLGERKNVRLSTS